MRHEFYERMTSVSERKGVMKNTRDGRRRFSREFKIAAVRRVLEGEQMTAVSRDLNIATELLWRWEKRVAERGEEHLYDIGQRAPDPKAQEKRQGARQQRRIAELERLVGRQQLEIRFLATALRQVEELRPQKNDDGGAASSKR
jgi:transposase